jgi:uncharacterized protein (DUF697 family)
MAATLQLRELVKVVRDVRHAAASTRPVVVAGVLAGELAKQLGAGGDPGAVRVGGDPRDGAVYVLVLAGEPSDEDLRNLRVAARAIVPVVGVQTARTPPEFVPYVVATDVVRCPPGQSFPLDEIAGAVARRLGPNAAAVAARLPTLRAAVARRLVDDASLRTALIGLMPGGATARFPLLALVQARLVLDLAAANGEDVGPERAPDLGVVIGTGLTLRALVRRLGLTRSRAVAGLTGYTGTRALGEAAIRRYDVRPPTR